MVGCITHTHSPKLTMVPVLPTLSSPGAPNIVRSFLVLLHAWQGEGALETCLFHRSPQVPRPTIWRPSWSQRLWLIVWISTRKGGWIFGNNEPYSFLGRQAAVAISWRSLVAIRAEERDAWWTLSFSRRSKVSRFKNILGSHCYR